MDVLSSVAELLRLRGHSYGHVAFGAPFAFTFPTAVGHFFVITAGRCRLIYGIDQTHVLATGDFVFLPSQQTFAIFSADADIAQQPRPFSEDEGKKFSIEGRLVVAGDHERGVEMVSGCFSFAPHEESLLTEHLEGPLTFQTVGKATIPWMTAIFQVIVEEAQPERIGSFAIIDRLAEVLLLQALRAKVQLGNCRTPNWLVALRDPLIGKSIREMHFDLQRNWTVEELARSVGMSRSGFAVRFRELVGRTPMEHLTRWRMLKAAHMLADQTNTISKIVAAVGYRSDGAFRRQFAEVMGVSATKYRENLLQATHN